MSEPQSNEGAQALSRRSGAGAWIVAALFAGAVVVAGAVGVQALYARAAMAEGPAPRSPLRVVATPLEMVDSYAAVQRFIGRIEPARETRAAFELGGIVRSISVDEGDRVEAGQALATLDIEALQIEDARLAAEGAALEADLALAEATTERRDALQGRGFESSQNLDEARFAAEAVRARIAGIAAQRRRIALDIERSSLPAPFDGVVSERLIDEGAVLTVGAPVLTLQETTRPQARIGVPVDVAQALRPEEALSLTVSGETVTGRLAAVSPTIDPATRTVALLIDLPPEAGAAMGEIARLELERRIEQRGAWVPLAALREATRGLWAVQIAATPDERDPAAERSDLVLSSAVVEVLYVRNGDAFVRGGVRDGALIVTSGPHRGALGEPVTLAPDAAAPAEAAAQ